MSSRFSVWYMRDDIHLTGIDLSIERSRCPESTCRSIVNIFGRESCLSELVRSTLSISLFVPLLMIGLRNRSLEEDQSCSLQFGTAGWTLYSKFDG